MPLTPGTKLGPYEIVSALGAGGMGEVYRARDTRLERTVALKILEPGVSVDSERLQRFEQEARAASALHHANIVTIFDVGQQNGTSYLVMELVEGRPLRDLVVAALPLKKALAIGAQIADGLAKAHAAGIVHRDLKPENIMVASDGLVKVLDFGVAKLAGLASGSGMTLTAAASGTQPGVVLGTVGYMSPEQARGASVDFRSDQFALGTVLYEMLTGKRPFQRESSAQTMAAIIEDEPAPISDLNPKVPAPVRWIVERCLAKEREERYASTRDLARDLQRARDYLSEPTSTTAGIHAPPAKAGVNAGAGMVVALVAVALIAFFLGSRFSRHDGAPAPIYRAALMAPPGHSFVAYEFSISPDGTKLAYPATSADGVTTLWVKSLQSGSDQEFSGTESAGFPFWSPDGRQLGFFAAGKLKKVELATGAVQTVCDAQRGRGGAWSPNGTIVFSPGVGLALERVPATGGMPAPATVAPQGMSESHFWPRFLPDGRHFLFFTTYSETRDGLYVASVEGSETKLISKQIHGNVEFDAGHLLFVRDGSLYAQRFDTEQLELKGAPVPIVNQELEQVMGFFKSGFTVSATGALVYQSRHSYSSRLTWFDRSGKELGTVGERGALQPSLSPDGRFLTAILDSENNGRQRVHVVDLARGASTSITPASDQIEAATWAPDGTEVVYSASMYTEKGRISELRRAPADGSGRDNVLFRAARLMMNDWSRNGRYLVFMNFEKGPPELWIYDMETSQASGVGFQSAEGQFSPDGRWLSHTVGARYSRPQVFVRSFPGLASRVQISTTGGGQARWRPDGKELYYIADDKRLMAVSVKVGQKGLEASPPTPLFQTRIHGARYALFQYAVSADGQRFLVNSLPREDAAAPMMLLTDWTSQIRP
jgi:serine/threonine protein kinase